MRSDPGEAAAIRTPSAPSGHTSKLGAQGSTIFNIIRFNTSYSSPSGIIGYDLSSRVKQGSVPRRAAPNEVLQVLSGSRRHTSSSAVWTAGPRISTSPGPLFGASHHRQPDRQGRRYIRVLRSTRNVNRANDSGSGKWITLVMLSDCTSGSLGSEAVDGLY